jgi:hypothetical protein
LTPPPRRRSAGGGRVGVFAPYTCSAARSTACRSTRRLPAACAFDIARSQMTLMRRGTPRQIWWIRPSDSPSNGIGPFRPATARRCAM